MSSHRQNIPAPPRETDPWDGLLLVDKPQGPTSHDIVHKVRKHFGVRKVGHGGTLDPMATGLLVLLMGRGTKLSNEIMGSDKVYEGTMTLGVSTHTEDADGEIVATGSVSAVTEDDIRKAMQGRVGDMMQTPPMVSAVKKNGVPLYKLARKGKTVEREPRLIHIYDFTLTSYIPPEASFRLRCTKGTYVRSLCADIGQQLGCGAHLSALRRTESGLLSIDEATDLDTILSWDIDELCRHVITSHAYRAQQPSA